MMPPRETSVLGVVIVTYNSSDVILDCLESLLSSTGVFLRIVVVDNASTDATVDKLHLWAQGTLPYEAPETAPFPIKPIPKPIAINSEIPPSYEHIQTLTLFEASENRGFAAGVNIGLAALAKIDGINNFWILNPDSLVPPGTAAAFLQCKTPKDGFSLMGGRIIYYPSDDVIQIDGGIINRATGVTSNINQYKTQTEAQAPEPTKIDFISGASVVASRLFYERAGPMPEDYFLYYEEVDWALRRKELPLVYCQNATIYHKAGTSIGSPSLHRPASPFSLYFKHRARIKFIKRYYPFSLPFALSYSFAKAGQLFIKGYTLEALTIIRASFGLKATKSILNRPNL